LRIRRGPVSRCRDRRGPPRPRDRRSHRSDLNPGRDGCEAACFNAARALLARRTARPDRACRASLGA